MPDPTSPLGPGGEYRLVRTRLGALLADVPPDHWDRPVAACPGWTVRGVASHLVGTVEDALAGRISGPPDEATTAAQVARRAGAEPGALLADWDEQAPAFEDVVDQLEIWPACIDVVSHEHDLRAALERPGARDEPVVRRLAAQLVDRLEVDGTVEFDLADGATLSSPGAEGPTYRLRTTAFEVLRLRLGRRSADQVTALDWSTDPAPILPDLFVFGPRVEPLIE